MRLGRVSRGVAGLVLFVLAFAVLAVARLLLASQKH